MNEEWQRITFDVFWMINIPRGMAGFSYRADLESLKIGELSRITIAEPNAAWHPCIETVILRGRVSAW